MTKVVQLPVLAPFAGSSGGTSSSVTPATAAIRDCETDFVLLRKPFRGPLDFVIGECKSAGGEITQTTLLRFSSEPQSRAAFLICALKGFAITGLSAIFQGSEWLIPPMLVGVNKPASQEQKQYIDNAS